MSGLFAFKPYSIEIHQGLEESYSDIYLAIRLGQDCKYSAIMKRISNSIINIQENFVFFLKEDKVLEVALWKYYAKSTSDCGKCSIDLQPFAQS